MTDRPNILVLLTDQQRFPPPYETDEIRAFREQQLPAQQGLLDQGVSFQRHYVMSAACAPSRASLLTGQYPSWHGVAQTDGIAKSAHAPEIRWLTPDEVPTLGHWFRAGGYRTYYKGKWHASHTTLPDPDGSGDLQTLDSKGRAIPDAVQAYLDADLLDPFGFSEWVGPEPHGLGKQNTGTMRDPFTADETIELLERLDGDDDPRPWLTVCSFLNPHDIALWGLIGLTQGLRSERGSDLPDVPDAPTRHEDLSTKPTCQRSYVDEWTKMYLPQPITASQRRFYYQLHRTLDSQLQRVLAALAATAASSNTIVLFTSDHGDMLGAHGGMHQKWHNAYDETTRVPFLVAGPGIAGGGRAVDTPSSHADIVPTLLGLAGIDADEALAQLEQSHALARPLAGQDLSPHLRGAAATAPEPVLFMTDDEISEGDDDPASPVQKLARRFGRYNVIKQPNHVQTVVAQVEVDGAPHTVKLSRYHDDQAYWTVPQERDDRLQDGGKLVSHTEPAPDEYELYDLTLDPYEERNLAHPEHASDDTRALAQHMHALLVEQLERKRVVPDSGVTPGYRPPAPIA